jgi:predicted ATPase/class 3 adenylate cyclase
MAALPTGTVTFLFTDIQGSSRLWEDYPAAMPAALAQHDSLLRGVVEAHGGRVTKTTGDGLHAVFDQASAAVAAALAGQQAMGEGPWPGLPQAPLVRMGLHTGEAQLREGDYFGSAINRAAHVMALAAGGQTLLSSVTAELAAGQLPEGAALVALGEHRLKDLVRPERLYQLNGPGLPAAFPPLRSLNSLPNNLPIQLTSFIGREREMAEARRLLQAARLLTLTGPGGTGKTRLSLQLAAEVAEMFPDGVWLAELAPLSDPALLPQTVASIWAVHAQPGRTMLDTLADYLLAKQLLLILDNCEHLIEACAQLAAGLLGACPRLKLLCSSREALSVPGETAQRVPSLSLPDPRAPLSVESFSQSEAARLFVERARAAQSSFELAPHNLAAISQICQRLDGIPLALELAAARTRLLSVEQIAQRLDDRFRLLTGGSRTALPRQQTLRALIDWSYDLLSPDEKTALGRLSVFTGGWTLDAAEAVLGPDALEALSHLVDKSLVVVDQPGESGEARYRLLETIRQYARDRLLESGDSASARDAHLRHFQRMALAAEPGLRSRDLLKTLDTIEIELDNLRSALEWALEADPRAAVQMAAGLTFFWQRRGHFHEGLEWVLTTLARYEALPQPAPEAVPASLALRAKALWAAATISFALGGLNACYSHITASVELARAGNDPYVLVDALCMLGLCMIFIGETGPVDAIIDEADRALRVTGDQWGQAQLLSLQAEQARRVHGHFAEANALEEAGIRVARELGNPWAAGIAIFSQAMALARDGDFAAARASFEEAEAQFAQLGDRHFINAIRSERGHIERSLGHHAQALAYYAQALPGWQEMGARPAAAHDLECIAFIACERSQPLLAVRLLAAADSMRAATNAPMASFEREEYDRVLASLRAELAPKAFNQAWDEGASMNKDEAVALGLEAAQQMTAD